MPAATSASDPAPRRIGGITLEQYAGVTAALAEGHPLGAILKQERILETTWSEASIQWAAAIADATDLQLELVEKRQVAEDALGRPLPPLDDDPVAWSGLLGAIALGDRARIIDALGLTMADIGRLGRKWKKKLVADPKLVQSITRAAPTAKAPSAVRAGPRVLRRFPWTPEATTTSAANVEPVVRGAAPFSEVEPVFEPPTIHLASYQREALQNERAPALASRNSAPFSEAAPGTPAAPPVGQLTAWTPEAQPASPATPFEVLDPAAHGVSLVRYADLVSQLQEPGADAAKVLAAWGLDAEKRRSIDDYFNRKFSREARWAAEFSRMLVQAQRANAERKADAAKQQAQGSASAAPPLEDSPPSQRPISAVPELGLEQYAWVFATLERTPSDHLEPVLARLRLTRASRALLDAKWAARMAAEPGLREAFAAAVQRHLAATPSHAPRAPQTSAAKALDPGAIVRPTSAQAAPRAEDDARRDAAPPSPRLTETVAWTDEMRAALPLPFSPSTRRPK
ncbi:MAG: hypothetical protein U0414_07415 [Polyangiaceae bacterium]